MIQREIQKEFLKLLKEYPVVAILGPRQSGKTTLAQGVLKNYQYLNLEEPELRSLVQADPKSFLKNLKSKVILDEIQRVPELLSYIQVIVDQNKVNGQFVLTGSHQLQLREALSQSLAGRVAVLNLLPFSISELHKAEIDFENFEDYAMHGFLPRIYDQKQRPRVAYSNYFQTYVERDVRLLVNLKDVSLFEKFMKLLAGRVGQLMDFTSLGNDVGADAKTIKNWLSILEASYIVFKLPPYFENFGKRVIKSPKYYFTDVGLLTFILGIENASQVTRDPLVGQIFENMIVMDILKSRYNRGLNPNLYFYRNSKGFEIDLLIQDGRKFKAIEIKSSQTFSKNLIQKLEVASLELVNISDKFLIYRGESRKLENMRLLNFKKAISF